jgi:aspartyl-tRNA(Asn)/glutamyl-tRNA(Gln) amidotransferase subunit C
MSISIEEVDRIAKLARLRFNEEEKQKLQQELSAILDYVDQLKQVEGKVNIEMIEDPDAVNLMRNDVTEELTSPEEFLKQAPERQGNFIKVKSVLD